MKTTRALIGLGIRQTRKSAIILALVAAFMVGMQGIAYAASYTDQKSRSEFAKTIESAPALGILYGEPKQIDTPSGYMIYRSVPVMSLVASIWALVVTTKLLRGQEEDGRTELLLASSTTAKRAMGALLTGFYVSLGIAFVLCSFLLAAIGKAPHVELMLENAALSGCAIFFPAILFGALGAVVSQLSVTRRRALYYGLFVVALSFMIRAIGNTVNDFYWLKRLTPLGWSDLLSPALNPQTGWLLLFLAASVVLIFFAFLFAARRDYGEGLLPESSTVKPRYFLLGSYTHLAIRQNFPVFLGWGMMALFVSGLIAALSNIAIKALQDSESLNMAVNRLGHTTDLRVAFVGSGLVFTTLVLMIMVSVAVSAIRNSEAKNYLDNLIVQPVRRSYWLIGRSFVIIIATFLIAIISGMVTWAVASQVGVSLDFWNFLLVSIALTGTLIFLTGLGIMLYGIAPKIAVAGMYVVILWSFIVDLIASVTTNLNDAILHSSLFHYISSSPTDTPDWKTFAWLVALGVTMAAVGVFAFTRRDIVSE